MKHSLKLERDQFHGIYRELRGIISSTTLRAVFLDIADNLPEKKETFSLADIDQRMNFIRDRGCKTTDTQILNRLMAKLVKDRILSATAVNEIYGRFVNQPARTFGKILIKDDSVWVVSWGVDGDDDNDYSLSKYDLDISEVVPESIIEIIRSVFVCVNSGSYVAAMSLALVALEGALWDHLTIRNIDKNITIERYPHRVLATLAWDGTDYNFELRDDKGNTKVPSTPGSISFEIERTSSKSGDKRYLTIEVDDNHSDWLSIADDVQIEEKEKGTLSNAIERARKEGLIPIDAWTPELDRVLITLRNNLVHQSNEIENKKFSSPFGEINMAEFYENSSFVMFFIRAIMKYIEEAYYDIGISKLK
jgi:hypothetical protein